MERNETETQDYSPLLQNRERRIALYNCIRTCLVRPILNRWLDVKMIEKERVPQGSCLFVTNHGVYFDALVIGGFFEKKVHGWIEENVYKSREWLYRPLELIPVKAKPCSTREEQRAIFAAYEVSKNLSKFWMANTNDGIALTSDGLAESCLNVEDRVKPLPERDNKAGPAGLGFEAGVPIVPVTAWIPEKHRRALLIADGKNSFKYLEANRKIPYAFYFSMPILPGEYTKKTELQTEIRKRQVDGWNLLEGGN